MIIARSLLEHFAFLYRYRASLGLYRDAGQIQLIQYMPSDGSRSPFPDTVRRAPPNVAAFEAGYAALYFEGGNL